MHLFRYIVALVLATLEGKISAYLIIRNNNLRPRWFLVAIADITLVLPVPSGFDPSDIAATALGAGTDGRTTYLISALNPTNDLFEGLPAQSCM